MKTFKHLVALLLLLIISAKANASYYGILEGTTLTYYYGAPPSNASIVFELYQHYTEPPEPRYVYYWVPADWDEEPLYALREQTRKIVLDESVANASATFVYDIFETPDLFYGMEHVTQIEGLEYLSSSDIKYTNCYIFAGCSSLTTLDLSSFDTSKVTDMHGMFSGCRSLTTLDLSNFDTSKVTDMSNMFKDCSDLNNIDLSSFYTDHVKNMSGMFQNCSNLTTLNLCTFLISSDVNISNMFKDCSNLTTIYYHNSWAQLSSDDVFEGCVSLVGGTGMTYNPDKTSGIYADNNGYLTYRQSPEPYTSYKNGTLTFCNDLFWDAHIGTYSLNEGLDIPGWVADHAADITKVVFNDEFSNVLPTTTRYWFYSMSKLRQITGLQNLNTSEVTDMGHMFQGCTSLINLHTENFDTGNVADMEGMFQDCSSITYFDLSNFSTDNLELTKFMFKGCSAMTTLDIIHLHTQNVIDMQGMFEDCTQLKNIDVTFLKTGNVTNMSNMFKNCLNVNSLFISNFKTDHVTDMKGMFYNCATLTSLDLSSFETGNVTNMNGMFYGCSNLTSLDVSGFDISSVTDMSNMFNKCNKLETIYASSDWSLTGAYASDMFLNCNSLKGGLGTVYNSAHVDLNYARIDGGTLSPGYFTEAIPTPYAVLKDGVLTFYYDSMKRVRQSTGTVYNVSNDNYPEWWDWGSRDITGIVISSSFAKARPTSTSRWFSNMLDLENIEGIDNLNTSTVTDMSYMFENCEKLTSLDLSHHDKSKVADTKYMFSNCSGLTYLNFGYIESSNLKDMSGMFQNCSSLTNLDLSRLSPRSVEDMNSMFENCESLESLNLSNFNTQAVTDMSYMFSGCTHLQEITFSPIIDTQNVLNMAYMFNDCQSLKEINVSRFNTGNVRIMYYMFCGCSSLAELDLSNFGTDYCTSMEGMFSGCGRLRTLDLTNFDTRRVTSMEQMFQNCGNMKTIYVGTNWSTNSISLSDEMFYGCTSLRGGMGTIYDPNNIGAWYAHIDGGVDNPGYFSDRAAIPTSLEKVYDEKETWSFTPDGIQHKTPHRGLNIETLKNGRVIKRMRK